MLASIQYIHNNNKSGFPGQTMTFLLVSEMSAVYGSIDVSTTIICIVIYSLCVVR